MREYYYTCLLAKLVIYQLLIRIPLANGACEFPSNWTGTWFQSAESGYVQVNLTNIESRGNCVENKDDRYIVEDKEIESMQTKRISKFGTFWPSISKIFHIPYTSRKHRKTEHPSVVVPRTIRIPYGRKNFISTPLLHSSENPLSPEKKNFYIPRKPLREIESNETKRISKFGTFWPSISEIFHIPYNGRKYWKTEHPSVVFPRTKHIPYGRKNFISTPLIHSSEKPLSSLFIPRQLRILDEYKKDFYIPYKPLRRIIYSRPDFDVEQYERECQALLSSLPNTSEERKKLERDTKNQSFCIQWFETRRKLVTASNFGRVCKLLPSTNTANMIKRMLYYRYETPAVKYGKKNEPRARRFMQYLLRTPISKCGLFVDTIYPYMGATPDGVIGNSGIVELKCPYSAQNYTPAQAIKKRIIRFWRLNGTIDKNHDYYYQIQGQLHITKKDYCMFGVWTPKGIKMANISRDDDFWLKNMRDKIQKFYLESLLPELVDSRFTRSRQIRNVSLGNHT